MVKTKKNSLLLAAGAAVPPVAMPSTAAACPWSAMKRMAATAAERAGEWGGAPIPMDHVRLVMEPRYPLRGLDGYQLGAAPATPIAELAKEQGWTLLNTWRSNRNGLIVYVCREKNGKSRVYFAGDESGQRLTFWFNTLGVAAGRAWDQSVEARALSKLRSLVSERFWKKSNQHDLNSAAAGV